MHTGNIPRFGGIGLFASFIVVFSIYTLVFHHGNFVNIAPLMIGGLIIFVEGILDDVFGLRVGYVVFLCDLFKGQPSKPLVAKHFSVNIQPHIFVDTET